MLLPNGNYLYLEATTYEKSKLVGKLLDDISKCLDENKTGISKSKIQEIVLCYNADLTPKETEELKNYVNEQDQNTSLSLYGLSRLSMEIALHHRNLAREYLQLPLDTGQIISLDQFVENYNASSQRIATPLANEFKHRKEELSSIKEKLTHNNLFILSGPPGVGKTKLAIEGINFFLNENLDYNAYALANKDADVLEDLDQYSSSSSKVILFVDDVNRYDRFSQVLGFFQYSNNLKLILTVRDYALRDVEETLMSFNFEVIHLQKFTDEEIKEIIESPPFEITNTRYHTKIFEIADGNPRLAIMAALLAKEKNRIDALYDVSDLYDKYFSTYIQDKEAFKNNAVLKALGIISFFYTIPYNDDQILERISEVFKISKYDFGQAIDELEKLELVQVRFEHVKIGEQNVGTFFFYKVFIKDKILSFLALLENYFFSIPERFKDTVIPANNTFGYERVMDKIKDDLKSFWKFIQEHSTENTFEFLTRFWFYLQEETLTYLYDEIQSLPSTKSQEYVTKYGNNDFGYDNNKYIELFGEFMRFNNDLQSILNIAFDYVRKLPQHLPELIKKLDERFSIDVEDEDYGLPRHMILLDVFESGISKKDRLLSLSFLAVSKNLLKFHFQQFKGVRGNAISMYRYPLQFYPPTKEFRKRIWKSVDILFDQFPNQCFNILMSHQRERLDFNKEIFLNDLEFLIPMINSHLKKESYRHCFYIQELIVWCKRNEIEKPEFQKWKELFSNQQFKWLKKSDWNHLRGKDEYEFTDWNKFRELKETDIRTSLIFKTVEDFESYLTFLKDVLSWEVFHNKQGFYDTLDIVLNETFCHYESLAFDFFKSVIDKMDGKFYPHRTLKLLASSKSLSLEGWEFLTKNNVKGLWKIEFLSAIPEESIVENWLKRVYETYNDLTEGYYLSFKPLEKYSALDPNLYPKLIKTVLNKVEEEGLSFYFGHDFIRDVSPKITDFSVVKRVYIIQQTKGRNDHYDYDGSELQVLLKRDPEFFIEYLEEIFSDGDRHSYRDHNELVAIWSLENYTETLDKTLEVIIEKDPYHTIGQHFMNVFFKNNRNNGDKAEKYLIRSVKFYNEDYVKLSIIIDVIFNNMNHLYEDAVRDYLAVNQDLESFKQVHWLPNEGVISGEVNWGDRRAAKWSRIKGIVESMEDSYKLIPIKKFVSDQIESAKKSGDWERKRKFLNPRW
jgi:DNA polymerase III delta prime subunit